MNYLAGFVSFVSCTTVNFKFEAISIGASFPTCERSQLIGLLSVELYVDFSSFFALMVVS